MVFMALQGLVSGKLPVKLEKFNVVRELSWKNLPSGQVKLEKFLKLA